MFSCKISILLAAVVLLISFLTRDCNANFIEQLTNSKQNEVFNKIAEYFAKESNFLNFQARIDNVSAPCMNKTIEFVLAMQQNAEWTMRTIDAWGKPLPGILNLAFNLVGDYSECLAIIETSKNWTTKYCTVQNGPVKYGVCFSDACNKEDISELLNIGLDLILPLFNRTIIAGVLGYVNSSFIECKEDKSFDGGAIFMIFLLSFIGLIILIGSGADLFYKYKEERKNKNNKIETELELEENPDNDRKIQDEDVEKKSILVEILLCFSVFTNGPKVFHIAKKRNADHFDCLNGIRVLSISWVILGHTYFNLQVSGLGNNLLPVFNKWPKQLWFLAIINGTFSVDTFFVMSGFLLSFLFLRETITKMKGTLTASFMFQYYFHRVWRLTPLFMIVTLFSAFLTPYMGNGPFYPKDGFEIERCHDTWWVNLLYLNNFIKPEKLCLGHSWYLSNDMQFHWIAPFILIPFILKQWNVRRNSNNGVNSNLIPTLGKLISFCICFGLIGFNILATSVIVTSNPGYEKSHIDPTFSGPVFVDVYVKPYCRIGTFIIGVLLGFIVFELKQNEIKPKIDYRLSIAAWFAAIFMCSLMVFGLYPDYKDPNALSTGTRIAYLAFSRIVWGLGIAYMIFACVTSNGGIINTILSHPFWIPLSRISYAVYLIHFTVLKFFTLRLEQGIYITHDQVLLMFFGCWFITFILGFFCSIFFESPFINLEKFILPSRKKKE